MTTLFAKPEAPDADAELTTLFEERFIKDGELDKEAIAKAWVHSQKHIKTVEADAAKLREETIKRLSYEDLLEKLKTMPNASNVNQDDDDTENLGDRNRQNVDIDAKIEEKLNHRLNQYQQSTIESENRAHVIAELRKAWGDNYVERLEQETAELGKTPDYVNALAGSDPKLLLKALGVNNQVVRKPIVNPSAPRSSISTRTGVRAMSKYEEYQALKKTDPKRYDSPAFQMEMLRVADEMGDKFYQKG